MYKERRIKQKAIRIDSGAVFKSKVLNFKDIYLGLIRKENVSESSNSPSSRIHSSAMFNFAHTPHHTVVPSTVPIPFITQLCLQLCPHPSSHCCAFNFALTLHDTCAFNFAHTPHHTVVSHHPWVTCHMCRTLDAPLLFITVPDNLRIDNKMCCTLYNGGLQSEVTRGGVPVVCRGQGSDMLLNIL